MSEKKMVRRSVVIALAIACSVLVVGLAGTFAYYIPVMNEKDNMVSSLNTQISQLNSNATNLKNQLNNLTDILNLNKSTVWVRGKTVNLWDQYEPVYEGTVTFAGYIAVQVSTIWINATVEVRYSCQGLNYDNKIKLLSQGGTATFPVLPSSNIQVFAFESDIFVLTGPLDADVTITYYY
jgi:CTP synthase (UTP-ammonia lyase)